MVRTPRYGATGRSRIPVTGLLLLGLTLMSCSPNSADTRSQEPTAPVRSKVLRIGMYEGEPTSGIALFSQSGVVFGRGGIGTPEHTYALHAGLTVYDERGEVTPRIAQKVPSLDDGDWVVFPDGRMEVTWKLRPDVRWHDGTPATAADFAFGSQIAQDRELPVRRGEPANLVTDVVALDPHTLLVRWKEPYTEANVSGPTDIPGVPAHLLAEQYAAGNKQAFANSRYWTSEFMGLGPYRLGEWVPGSYLEALAFDGYVLGRPRIDRIVFTYYSDASALYLSHLSGEIDMTPFGSFQSAHFGLFKSEWEAAGSGTALAVFSGSRNYRFQLKYPEAPWTDRRVRRALVHMLDRQALVDALLGGVSGPADTIASPSDPVYRLAEQMGLPRYPFDLAQAQRLMAEAGWTRGPDGMYRAATGQPLTLEVRVGNNPLVREASAITGQLKTAGVEPSIAVGSDGEIGYTFPGILGRPLRDNYEVDLANFFTGQIGSEANRWTGANRGGYSNPAFDRLYSQSLVTLNVSDRQRLIAEMLKLEGEDAASIHAFYDMAQQTIMFRKGVRGPGVVSSKQLIVAWNVHLWDMD